VVLADLAHQTPAEVLVALQAGDAAPEQGVAQAKAEDILRCVDYSNSNLSPETQGLLLCLAPFTAVVWEDMLEKYTAQLWEQPPLSDLSFERWPQVLQEAADWGLLSPHPDLSGFWHLQPVLPYFLKRRLAAPGQAEMRGAIETAFRRYYDRLSRTMAQLLNSQDAQEKQLGRDLVRLEYENLFTALNLALAARVSVLHPYLALSGYLEATQDHQQALELGQTVLARLEDYPAETLTGQLGAEFVAVLDAIARPQLTLKQYDVAEASYQKALELVARLEKIDQERRVKLEASVYHQLGTVAQEQRRWSQAEGYCHQALQAFIEFDDRHAQASIYHQLGTVAQEQGQWAQARDYFLRALETCAAYQDSQTGIVLRSLAQLWQASEDASLPVAVAPVLNVTQEQAEELLRREIGD
jgi:tetratricopeptide (TPR) repeat protein